MRFNTQPKPGFFWKTGRQHLDLSEVPRKLNLTVSGVTDAVALGELKIERVSACKVVSMDALFDYIAVREGKK